MRIVERNGDELREILLLVERGERVGDCSVFVEGGLPLGGLCGAGVLVSEDKSLGL